MTVEGQEEEIDKSVVDFQLIQSDETSFTLKINFLDLKVISTDITEPDVLIVNFTDPGLFIDAETGKPLSDETLDKRIKMGAQYTDSEFKQLLAKAKTASTIGAAVTIWELLTILVFKKVLFSMWVLILILQFFVYIGTWQIRYPNTL